MRVHISAAYVITDRTHCLKTLVFSFCGTAAINFVSCSKELLFVGVERASKSEATNLKALNEFKIKRF